MSAVHDLERDATLRPALVNELAQVDLNLLVTLQALLEEGSVTAAAGRLALSQSAVSHALRRLRRQFGDELLVRRGNRMVPTAEALRLQRPLGEALARVTAVLRRERELDPGRIERAFRLLAVDSAQIVLVPGLVRALRDLAPRASLEVQDLPGDEIAALLARGEFDLAVCYAGDLELPPQVRSETLFTARHVCLVRADLDLPERLSWRRYASLDHVVHRPRPSRYRFSTELDRELSRRGLQRRRLITVSSTLVIPEILLACDAVALLTEHEADECCARYPLRKVSPPFAARPFAESMLWDSRCIGAPAHRWLRELCRSACRRATSSEGADV